MIIRDKSYVLLNLNTSVDKREGVRQALNIMQEVKNERYLGLPVSIGQSRKKAFQFIKKKVWQRIQGW
jgi:hypothetical protein